MNANFAVSTQVHTFTRLLMILLRTKLLQEAPPLYTLTPQTSVVCRNETREGIIPTYFTTIGLRNMYMKVNYHMPKLLVFTNLWTIIKIIENRSLLIDKVNRVKNDKKDRTV